MKLFAAVTFSNPFSQRKGDLRVWFTEIHDLSNYQEIEIRKNTEKRSEICWSDKECHYKAVISFPKKTTTVEHRPEQCCPHATTTIDSQYLMLRIHNITQLQRQFLLATERIVSSYTVRNRLHYDGLHACMPMVCIPLTSTHLRDWKRLRCSTSKLDTTLLQSSTVYWRVPFQSGLW